ncbi:MAG: oxidoreductase [Alphaproteobacteria bacterium]|nr:oxidoreductase [Alphaproteobacteria bacterium]|tara:strand:+ start:9830 stop:10843 length:1014 start_codon:yes stop_codon:yes gene_type:complete
MIKVGIVGFGYWGPNLARNFAHANGTLLTTVCDLDAKKLSVAQDMYPYVETTQDYRDIISNTELDAIAIATPLSTHFEIASQALNADKHVLITKPLAPDRSKAAQLVELAAKRQLTLLVDHTFVYTPAVRKIRELISENSIGTVYYYDSTRINLGIFQHDTSVTWDLATHDLSILDHLLEDQPIAVSANGINHFSGNHENIAYLTLFYPSQVIAHINVNWLAPVKVRRTLIGGSEKMIVYDDMEPSEKIKVYDKGVEITDDPQDMYNVLISYRSGDMWAPRLDHKEALSTEIEHFVSCIEAGEQPITDGEMGLRIVSILEASNESVSRRGEPISLDE